LSHFSAEEIASVQKAPLGPKLLEFYDGVYHSGWPIVAELGRKDRYFLLTYILKRKDATHPWIYARCREVEANPNNCLDLWAREHYKSTVITFAGAIQEVVNDPEITIGIFSFNNATATKFMTQIKAEMEDNVDLHLAYPEIFYTEPRKHASRWSEQKGIVVKRKSNPKEATIEAHGLIEGMPTGAHYQLRIYDDVITPDSVSTPEMINKVTDAWRLSQNLGTEGGRKWHIGTRYHFNDTYRIMIDDELVTPRIHPATKDGTPEGEPFLISKESLAEKRASQGPYIFAAQQLLNPVADEAQGFKREWVKYYDQHDGKGLNVYLLVDPANEKKKHSDYSAFFVVGLGADRNYYILDMVRDRFNLTERANTLFRLHAKWRPKLVGYEKYGKDSDIQHFETRMKDDNYRFHIQALGGQTKKEDRIRRLIPTFETGHMWFPESLEYTDSHHKMRDLVRDFVEQEMMGFPVALHDDMLDCLARILDPNFPVSWPKERPEERQARLDPRMDRAERYTKTPHHNTSWMSF
jgi:predicted phage terminase large subunit-like protein